VTDLDAWLYSAPLDAPPPNPGLCDDRPSPVGLMHSPAETVRRGVRTLDARRPYGWWRTAEVRQLVEDAAQSRRFEARWWLTPWTDSIAKGNEMVATLRARGRL